MADRIEIVRFTYGPFDENPYLVVGPSGRSALLVDPGLGSEPILAEIEARRLTLAAILNTHGHVDHVACNRFFKERTGAPLAIHPADRTLLAHVRGQAALWGLDVLESPEPDLALTPGADLELDGVRVEILHTPGHTPGGVCLRVGEALLVGDTLFQGSVGRTDLPGGSWPELLHSIRETLFRLPGGTVCWPGHGPETTLDAEKSANPFVSDEAVAARGRT